MKHTSVSGSNYDTGSNYVEYVATSTTLYVLSIVSSLQANQSGVNGAANSGEIVFYTLWVIDVK